MERRKWHALQRDQKTGSDRASAQVYRVGRGKAASPPARTGSATQGFACMSSSVCLHRLTLWPGVGWGGGGWPKSTYPEFRK